MGFPVTGLERYRPRIATTASSDPAANTEISYTVPSGQVLHLLGARVSLVTDANAANRTVQLQVDDGTTVFNLYASPSTQAASLTYAYSFVAGGNNTTVLNNNVIVGLGTELYLPSGYKITTVTNNRQATDNFGAMTIYGVFYKK